MLGYLVGYYSKNKQKSAIKPYNWTVLFPNKGVELIDVPGLLKDRKLLRVLPGPLPKPVRVAYKYTPPVGSKLCNHTSFLKDLNRVNLKHSLEYSCGCQDSAYMYNNAGHIITGDLNIISNPKLRQLFGKGARYRVPRPIEWNEVYRVVSSALDKLMCWLVRKAGYTEDSLRLFKQRFLQLLNSRILHCIHNVRVEIDDTFWN